MDDALLTLQQVADRYGVSVRTVSRWANRVAVEKVKIGGTVRIRLDHGRGDGGTTIRRGCGETRGPSGPFFV